MFYVILTICYKVICEENNLMLLFPIKTEVKLQRNSGRLKLLKVTQETGSTEGNLLVISIAVFIFFKFYWQCVGLRHGKNSLFHLSFHCLHMRFRI